MLHLVQDEPGRFKSVAEIDDSPIYCIQPFAMVANSLQQGAFVALDEVSEDLIQRG